MYKFIIKKDNVSGLPILVSSDYGFNVDLGQTNMGQFVISGFNDVENKLFAVSNQISDRVNLEINDVDGEIIASYRVSGVLTNDIQTICIDVCILSDYTDAELSAISHAQSILYRAGLKDLASTIGAPRPKKP